MSSRRIAFFGMTGMGKSEALRRLFLANEPRQIILDANGDWIRERGVIPCRSFRELLERLYMLAARDKWVLVVPHDQVDPQELAELLVPPYGGSSLTLSVGGLALVLDEAYSFAPTWAMESVKNIWRRGRHELLSVYACSQRPQDVSPIVRSSSELTFLFQMGSEPAVQRYVKAAFRDEVAQRVLRLPPYEAVVWHNRRLTGYHMAGNPLAITEQIEGSNFRENHG